MKKYLLLVLFNVSSFLCVYSDEIGLRIDDIMKKNVYCIYKKIEFQIPIFPKIHLGLLAYETQGNGIQILGTFNNEKLSKAFGIFCQNNGDYYYVVDLDGKGTLGYKTKKLYIPNWVFYEEGSRKKVSTAFLEYCNSLYAIYNDPNEGPKSDKLTESIKTLSGKVSDLKTDDIESYYSLLTYYYYEKEPKIALSIIINTLDRATDLLPDDKYGLFYLFSGLSLMELNYLEEALDTFRVFKDMDKKSVVAKYYYSYLLDCKNGGSTNLDNFKVSYPDFWALR